MYQAGKKVQVRAVNLGSNQEVGGEKELLKA